MRGGERSAYANIARDDSRLCYWMAKKSAGATRNMLLHADEKIHASI